jgi:hypothetical protein
MTHDTSTAEGRDKRTAELVEDYKSTRNWGGIVRLIGGSPRYDLQDQLDADAGEPPKGAR